jgi:hypothetical protein
MMVLPFFAIFVPGVTLWELMVNPIFEVLDDIIVLGDIRHCVNRLCIVIYLEIGVKKVRIRNPLPGEIWLV